MFNKLSRELERMQTGKMSFSIEPDKDGFIDKECPNSECLYQFKVNQEDWKNIFRDEAVYCPKCGKDEISKKWFTKEQINAGKAMAINNVKAQFGNALRNYAQEFNRTTKKGLLTFSMSVNGFNERKIYLPIKCKNIFEQKIQCEKCNARYAVIGSAFFCPSCGDNSARHMFNEFMNTTNAKIENMEIIKNEMENLSKDDSERIARVLMETIPNDLVTALQCLSEAVYVRLPNNKVYKKNAFQRIDDSINIWKEAVNESYEDWITNNELTRLRKYYQQRHLLTHNNGIIDEEYIRKSNDTNYTIGQRLIIDKKDVIDFTQIVQKIGNEILKFNNNVK